MKNLFIMFLIFLSACSPLHIIDEGINIFQETFYDTPVPPKHEEK